MQTAGQKKFQLVKTLVLIVLKMNAHFISYQQPNEICFVWHGVILLYRKHVILYT